MCATNRLTTTSLLFFMLLLLGCGGGASHLQLADGAGRENTPQIDPELWRELTEALNASLAKYASADQAPAPPSSTLSKVPDFRISTHTPTQVSFAWSFRSQGDYDQNGEVNISDLTQIGQHFHATTADADWVDAQASDGDANGEINLADVTSIGQQFHVQLDGFVVEQNLDPADDAGWSIAGSVLTADGILPAGGAFKEYTFSVGSPAPGLYYRVRAYLGDPLNAPALGIPSDSIQAVDLQPPTGITASQGAFSDKVVLAWTAVDGATGYKVFRDVQDSPLTTTGTEFVFEDVSLPDYLPHTYWLSSVFADGESGLSLPVTGFKANRGDWWMFGRESTQNRLSPFTGPQNKQIKWGYNSHESFAGASPVIGADGTVYVGSGDTLTGTLWAINPDGTKQWSFPTGGSIVGSPAIAADGTVYAGCYDGNLYAIDPSGSKVWNYPLNFGALASPSIGPDGTVYVADFSGLVLAINPNGTLKWGKPVTSFATSSAGFGIDGTAYVASSDGNVHALDGLGNEKWAYPAGDYIDGAIAYRNDDVVLFATEGGVLYAVNALSGKKRWSYNSDSGVPFFTAPALGADGTAYIGDSAGTFYAINPNGTLGWSYPAGAPISSAATLDAAGNLYFGCGDNRVIALTPAGTLLWDYKTDGPVTGSAAIGSDGIMYIGSTDGFLYAFGPAPQVAPETPTGVSATDGSLYLAVKVTWDRQLNVDSYDIYRDAAGAPIGSVAGDIREWTDTSLADATPHTYKVKALNAFGPSGFSASDTGYASADPPGPGDWATFGHDAMHSRRSPFSGSHTVPANWSFLTGGSIYSSACIGSNNEIYFSSDDFGVYCVNSDGSLRWKYTATNYVDSSPAIGADGEIYVGDYDGNVLAIKPNGTLDWAYPTGDAIYSSPVFYNDRIYIGSMDHSIYCLKLDGSEDWSTDLGGMIFSTPAIGSDGKIYVGVVETNSIVCLNTNGTVDWAYPTTGEVRGSPAVYNDVVDGDIIFCGSNDFSMYCLDKTGSEIWSYPTGGIVFSSPALFPDGSVCFGSGDGFVYSVAPDGTLNWSADMFAPVYSSPAIDNDGYVYVGDSGGFINCITPAGIDTWYTYTGAEVDDSSPAIGADGTVYMGDSGGRLYAFLGPGS